MPLVQTSLTHPSTYTHALTSPNTPPHTPLTPVTWIQTALTHPQAHPHTSLSPPPCPHPHIQNGYLENKHSKKQTNKQKQNLIQSNSKGSRDLEKSCKMFFLFCTFHMLLHPPCMVTVRGLIFCL